MLFFRYLSLAAWWVASNKNLWRGRWRPPKNLYDIVVCLAIRKYFNFSLRRGMGLLRLFRALGAINASIPCFKTLDNYQRSDEIRPYLDEVLKLTTEPLRFLEHFFATDTTGTASTCYSSWFDIRTRREGRKRQHLMAHVAAGTKLKAAVAFDARTDRGGHSEVLREHIKEVAAISAKKRKFGSFVRARKDASKENEEVLSWVGYNFSVLCRAVYEFRLNPHFAT